jgi:hypothetical protein
MGWWGSRSIPHTLDLKPLTGILARYLVTTNLFSPQEGIVMAIVSSYAESPFRHL